ncbi:MAG TPA: methionine adenosyltransferase [Candidatus Cloacimonadota bacterium]|nr:methionine adenosyltransferase [Candidatus Cloacimonadota bacterium]
MTALHADTKNVKSSFVFSSESVSEGHPDKVCDQISDAILDAYLREDPRSRVAVETMATTNRVIISGEVASTAQLHSEQIAREVIRNIGYTTPNEGFDEGCTIENYLHKQTGELNDNQGAGDQGLMFGYACTQTLQLMPIPIVMAHKLLQELTRLRKNGEIQKLLPDAKSQVSFKFHDRMPVDLRSLVISTNHLQMSKAEFAQMQRVIREMVVEPVIEQIEQESIHEFKTRDCAVQINPLGMWEHGGPAADTGLTGRKIIVDTYGGWAQHGGGAFSGKDATKVDRSAAYMARHIAKSVVGSGLAKECLIQFGFIIGEERPVSLMVDTFASGIMPDSEIEKIVVNSFDLTVKGIIDYLDLRTPVYLSTAAYGHFGRDDVDFSWEKVKKLI